MVGRDGVDARGVRLAGVRLATQSRVDSMDDSRLSVTTMWMQMTALGPALHTQQALCLRATSTLGAWRRSIFFLQGGGQTRARCRPVAGMTHMDMDRG